MINCIYPEIKGGVNAIIEEDGKVIAHQKFEKLNDAVNWTNAWVSGYTKPTENDILNESKELIKQINKRFQNTNPKIEKIVTKSKMGYCPDIMLMAELDKLRMDSVALQLKMERINGN